MANAVKSRPIEVRAPVSNDAAEMIRFGEAYNARVTVEGLCPLLMHAWSNESVAEKAASAKNSKAKKTDDVESYLYRVSEVDRRIGIAGKCFHGALIVAGKSKQDPRSPRKSACDLLKAGIIVNTLVAPFEPDRMEADYLDAQRVVIQRNAVTRMRPAMNPGWRVTFDLTITLPEYLSRPFLQEVIREAGRVVGLCDYRPSHGRFAVVGFEAA